MAPIRIGKVLAMRRFLLAVLLSVFAVPAFAQGAPPQAAANQPYTIEYY